MLALLGLLGNVSHRLNCLRSEGSSRSKCDDLVLDFDRVLTGKWVEIMLRFKPSSEYDHGSCWCYKGIPF